MSLDRIGRFIARARRAKDTDKGNRDIIAYYRGK